MTPDMKTIAVIGLGYVGLPLAVEFGKSRPVIGFDINAGRIDALRTGKDATQEVSADELAAAEHLTFTTDPADLAAASTRCDHGTGGGIGRALSRRLFGAEGGNLRGGGSLFRRSSIGL